MAYLKFKLRTTASATGQFAIGLGNSTLANDNQGFTSHYGNGITVLSIRYTAGAITSVVRRGGGTDQTVTSSGFAKDSDQQVEIYGNNGAGATTYFKSGTTYSLSAQQWDLWVDGTKISPAGGWPKANTLASGVNLSGFAFFAETSSGNNGVMYVDDLEYSNTLPVAPTISSPSPTTLTGFTTTQGIPSASQTFTVGGTHLTADLVVTAPTGFEVRENGMGSFSSSVSFTPISGTVSSKTIEVRLTGTSVGSPSGDVACTSTDASTQNVSVSGTVTASGQPDCLGVIDGPAVAGTPCNDGDACTTGEVWDISCNCVNGVFQDQDNDGTCDANDGCPADPAKTSAGTCGCGNPEPGTACNDGNACTTGDQITTCGVCAGTPLPDNDSDGTCDAEDACPNDPNKIVAGTCGCGNPEPGATCDDGNAATVNDVITGACNCAGALPEIYWNFNTATPTVSTVPNTTVGALAQGNNNGSTNLLSTTSASSGYTGFSGGNNAGAAAVTGALDIGTSTYFQFTLTVSDEYVTTISAISFGSRSTSTGPQAFTLLSDQDDFTTPIATGTMNNNSSWALEEVTGLSFDATGTTVFRLYGHSGTGNAANGTANWRIDDLHLSASNAEAPPCVPVTITNTTSNSPICADETLTLGVTVAGSGEVLYEWTGAGTISNGDAANASVTGAATGNYHIVVVNECGEDEADVAVVVNTPTTWYQDADEDGFGDAAVSQSACAQPDGYVSNSTDLCPADATKQAPGACGCGTPDVTTTYYADTDGDGFGDANDAVGGFTCLGAPVGYVGNSTDLCPADANKQAPGACGCGTPDTDTDGDGLADCIDPCPALPGLENGNTCDDGNAGTGNDMVVNCVCTGQTYDCLNVPGGTAVIGSSCDDGNANTINDVYDPNCVCTGTVDPSGCTDLLAQNHDVGATEDDGSCTYCPATITYNTTIPTPIQIGTGLPADNAAVSVDCHPITIGLSAFERFVGPIVPVNDNVYRVALGNSPTSSSDP
ncbi:MAG TPA: hypothetical protein VGE21_08255, partial [Flavobacteriales bacterium]